MKRKVQSKQHNSKMCFLCGLHNAYGLKASFYSMDDDSVVCLFTAGERHQGYPGRLHGGISAAVLDETIGRAITPRTGEEVFGVTVDLSLRYRKPVPTGVMLRAVGRITEDSARFFEGRGEILLPDGSVAVEGRGRYMRIALERIGGFDSVEQEWRVVTDESDPEWIDVPD